MMTGKWETSLLKILQNALTFITIADKFMPTVHVSKIK